MSGKLFLVIITQTINNSKGFTMEKGLLVIIAVGALFGYFALSLFNTSSSTDDSKWTSASGERDAYSAYYKKDSIGDMVLNMDSVSLDKAKSLWGSTPTGAKISEMIPDFEAARNEIDFSVADGNFKNYLLKYLRDLQEEFLTGAVDSDKAKKLFKTLK
jgi:hypothetical protein